MKKAPILFASLMLIAGCTGKVAAPSAVDSKVESKVEEVLSGMTLDEKVGQMVMIGIYGLSVNEDTQFLLSQYHFGGIILFSISTSLSSSREGNSSQTSRSTG